MTITAVKTWGNEDLTPSDLNDEFANVYNNHCSLSTVQTITGRKTFSGGIAGGLQIESTDNAAASVIDALNVEWDPADGGNMTDTSSGLAIAFTLPDDADNQDVMGRLQLIVNDDAAGSEDTEWQLVRMVAGSLTAQALGTTINNATENELVTVASTTTELDAESNLTWDGTSMGVGIASPDGTLHVHTATAGAVAPHANGDDLVVENSGQAGISILAPDASGSNVYLGWPTSNEGVRLLGFYNSGSPYFSTTVSGTQVSYQTSAGLFGINETANANMTRGLTINQGANDNQILAFKSSDVNTGLTSALSTLEVDDFFTIQKIYGNTGGVLFNVAAENAAQQGTVTWYVQGGQASATQSTAAVGLYDMYITQHNGSNSLANMTSDGVMFTIRGRDAGGGSGTKFLVDEDGDIKYDGTDAGAFDLYEDAHLVRATSMAISPDVVMGKFDEMVKYDTNTLQDLGILSKVDPDDAAEGHRPMVSVGGCTRMLVGAAWQGYVRDMEMAEELTALKQQNALLEARLNLLEN